MNRQNSTTNWRNSNSTMRSLTTRNSMKGHSMNWSLSLEKRKNWKNWKNSNLERMKS